MDLHGNLAYRMDAPPPGAPPFFLLSLLLPVETYTSYLPMEL